jgi:nitrogen fixation protein NifQ
MGASEIYRELIGSSAPAEGETGFDAHVVASILAIGLADAEALRGPAAAAIGLEGEEIAGLGVSLLPAGRSLLASLRGQSAGVPSDDELCLRDLLRQRSTQGSPFERQLADMVARRCLRPNHLWQDLGLRDRGELSRLMLSHFRPLAERNHRDMKWKKFFYRTICRDEGFLLCTSPVCSECSDFANCFGEESGESLLAHLRNAPEARV